MNSNLMLIISKNELQDMLRDAVKSTNVSNAVVDFPINSNSPQLLSINDMCEMFKVSRVTISTWMKQGRLPFKKVSRRVYFILDEVLSSIPQFNLASVHSFQKSLKQGGKNDGTR